MVTLSGSTKKGDKSEEGNKMNDSSADTKCHAAEDEHEEMFDSRLCSSCESPG